MDGMQFIYGVTINSLGLFLAIICWRRCPKACFLLAVSSLLNLLFTLVAFGLPFQELKDNQVIQGEMRAGLGSIVAAIAHGLLFIAIFAGRNDHRRSNRPFGDEEDDERLPPKLSANDTNIRL